MTRPSTKQLLDGLYLDLLAAYGPQHWWPGETPFEVMVGAILTQSAAWANVERAIANLKSAGVLSPRAIRELPQSELAGFIRPSGYFNAKAKKLKALVTWLGRYGDDPALALAGELGSKRAELLSIHGIGSETADSILLYAGARPSFVIDAYTRRILSRLGVIGEDEGYEVCQSLFMDNLDADVPRFNEFHALFVRMGKETCCKNQPRCGECPLRGRCRG